MDNLTTVIVGIIIIHIGIYLLLLLFSRIIVKLRRWGVLGLEMIVLPASVSIFLEGGTVYSVFKLIIILFGTFLLSIDIKKQILRG